MKIIVIGSINVDYIGTTKYELMLGESHPGSVSIQALCTAFKLRI